MAWNWISSFPKLLYTFILRCILIYYENVPEHSGIQNYSGIYKIYTISDNTSVQRSVFSTFYSESESEYELGEQFSKYC